MPVNGATDPAPPEDMEVSARRFVPFISRVSTAVHRAGFRRSGSSNPLYMHSHFLGESRFYPVAAPNAVFKLTTFGNCSDEADIEFCIGRRHQERNAKGALFAVTLEATVYSSETRRADLLVSLWSEEIRNNISEVQSWSWNLEAELLEESILTFDPVAEKIAKVTAYVGQENGPGTTMLTGLEWQVTDLVALEDALARHRVHLLLVRADKSPGLPAIRAAEEARVYQRLSWVFHPPLVEGYPPIYPSSPTNGKSCR